MGMQIVGLVARSRKQRQPTASFVGSIGVNGAIYTSGQDQKNKEFHEAKLWFVSPAKLMQESNSLPRQRSGYQITYRKSCLRNIPKKAMRHCREMSFTYIVPNTHKYSASI